MKPTSERKYQLLIDVLHKVRDTFDLNEILGHLLDTVKTFVNYDAGGIFVLNQDLVHGKQEIPKQMIAGMIQRGYDLLPMEDDAMLKLGKGIVGYVISSGSSLIIPDVRLDARYIKGRSRTRSEIAVPIIRTNRTIGALNLESDQLATYDQKDLEILRLLADAAGISIEKAMLHKQLIEKELLDQQLQLARDVQSRLFPGEPPHIPGYDIAGVCLPAEEIAGDYYDFIKLNRDRLGVVVADVSGHGIASALMMTAFRGMIRMYTHGKLGEVKIARTLNRLLPEFTGGSHFITAFYVVLNLMVDELTYVSCGHQPALLLHPNNHFTILDDHGPVLGFFKNVNYSAKKMPMNPGDILVMFTDGVVEITSPNGEEFGIEGLKTTLQKGRHQSTKELIQMIIQTTRQFSVTQSALDDFTLVIIKKL